MEEGINMKIALDTDGTLTDFNQFINEHAIKYFTSKYNFKIKNQNALEIEEIFDIKNTLMKEENLSSEDAQIKTKKILDEFWIGLNFVKFSIGSKFRPGVRESINKLIKEGHDISIHTSRDKTCENSLVGKIARKFTIWQFYINGIFLPKRKFYFYENDDEKIKGIVDMNADLVLEDKLEIINELCKHSIKTICISGNHNKSAIPNQNIEIMSDFSVQIIEQKMNNLFGSKTMKYYRRSLESDRYYNHLKFMIPIFQKFFHPIVINKENIIKVDEEGVVYAPNHRSTLDPLAITSVLNENIHWAALLRFFEGKDSIFNNSKNPILCKITANLFRNLEYFPIDRKSDNPDANNLQSLRDMNNFLKICSKIGIFGEGTTRRDSSQDFNEFDDSFLLLAKKNGARVQPITCLWIKELNIKSKVIINFGESFKVEDMTKDQAMDFFMTIQKRCLEENKRVRDELAFQNTAKRYFKK